MEKCLNEKYDLIKLLESQLTTSPANNSTDNCEIEILVEKESLDTTNEEIIEKYTNLGTEYECPNDVITEIDDDSPVSSLTENEESSSAPTASKTTEEIEETYSLLSMESSSTSEASNSHEAMASFLKYKRIREKSLEKARKSGATQQSKDDSFYEVFNTVHYF